MDRRYHNWGKFLYKNKYNFFEQINNKEILRGIEVILNPNQAYPQLWEWDCNM